MIVPVNKLTKSQWAFLILAAIFYIGAGILHFTKTEFYVKIMPPYIPAHMAMVYISGAAEIAGGLGLLVPMLRRRAAWGLVALLVAVFPANVYMLTDHQGPEWILWSRLPLQVLFIWWVLWCTKPRE